MLPYGEWIIFSLALGFWAEKASGRRLMLALAGAWIGGRILEIIFASYDPWNWHYARLSVIFIFWLHAWQRAKRRGLPLILMLIALLSKDLFVVNEPGIFFADKWFFTGVMLLAAFISTHDYWDIAAAISGSLLINQGLSVFLFDGIMRVLDLPDDFTWNFWVIFMALGALIKKFIELRRPDLARN